MTQDLSERPSPVTTASATGVAGDLAEALTPFIGDLPVHLTAWDGSTAGPLDAPHVRLNSPNALRRLLWYPGELGAAQAYVTGEIDIEGSVADALRHAWAVVAERDLTMRLSDPRAVLGLVQVARRHGAFGRRPKPPKTQIAVSGRLHSKRRDREVIHHHYDLSNDFYELILDANMAYSSGYVTGAPLDGGETADYSLEDAQRDKLDLVCRKIGLHERAGMTMLDVGCGWGSLSLHAAQHYGAKVTGVTIAAEQKAFIDKRIRDRGLGDLVTIELCDYRDVRGTYDAVASLEMGEHAGDKGYPDYTATLYRSAAPGARVLIQQMSRRGRHPGGGPFIEAFIAPDMTMRPVGDTVALLEDAGLEVRDVHAMREHYVWTVRGWQNRFDAHRDELTALVGDEVVRVWELYLAGGLLTFEQGRMGVDQILSVRRPSGPTGLPAVRPREWSDPRD